MTRLQSQERIVMFGGASKATAKRTTRKTKSTRTTSPKSTVAKSVEVAAATAEVETLKPKKTTKFTKANEKKKEAKILTKINDGFYNAGQISVAAFSVAEHFNYSIPKLISALNRDDEGYSRYHGKDPKLLRPNFRFSRNYWNSSINYGTPSWYY